MRNKQNEDANRFKLIHHPKIGKYLADSRMRNVEHLQRHPKTNALQQSPKWTSQRKQEATWQMRRWQWKWRLHKQLSIGIIGMKREAAIKKKRRWRRREPKFICSEFERNVNEQWNAKRGIESSDHSTNCCQYANDENKAITSTIANSENTSTTANLIMTTYRILPIMKGTIRPVNIKLQNYCPVI